jgi:hypothetical protein
VLEWRCCRALTKWSVNSRKGPGSGGADKSDQSCGQESTDSSSSVTGSTEPVNEGSSKDLVVHANEFTDGTISAGRSVKEMLEALQPSPNETTFAK